MCVSAVAFLLLFSAYNSNYGVYAAEKRPNFVM